MVVISAALASSPADTQTRPGHQAVAPRRRAAPCRESRRSRASRTISTPHSRQHRGHQPGQEVRADAAIAGRGGMVSAPAARASPISADAGADQGLHRRWDDVCVMCCPPGQSARKNARAKPGAIACRAGRQIMPDLTMVARRLANSSSTNFSNAGAGQHRRRPVVLLQRLGPGLGLERRQHHVGQRLALRGGDAGRAVHAAPVADLDVDALLLQRRAR